MESRSLHGATRPTSCLSSHQIAAALWERSLNWRLVLALLTNVGIWFLLLRSFAILDH